MNLSFKNENKTIFRHAIVFIATFLILSLFLSIPIFENNSQEVSLFQLMLSNIFHLSSTSILKWLFYAFIPLSLYLVSLIYFIATIILFIQKNGKINGSQYLFFQIIYLILLADSIVIGAFYYFSARQIVLYVIGLLLLLSSLICNYLFLKKEWPIVDIKKEKSQKMVQKNKTFLVHAILSFLFCIALIVFLAIKNIDYQGGDGIYSWLLIVLESMSPYFLFDSFYPQVQSLLLFVTFIIVLCYAIQLLLWCFKQKPSISLSTLLFYEINFILCSSLFLIFDLDISAQYRIVFHLSLYLVLPGLCFGLYHFIYTLVQAKKVVGSEK